MMRLVSIASSSEGNCTLIENEDTAILIDVGVSCKRVEKGLSELGHTLNDISAIFISHEHTDHVSGLGVISRKYNVPVFSGNGTIQRIRYSGKLGDIDPELFSIVRDRVPVTVGSLNVLPFAVSHDAAEPLMYKVYDGDMTDPSTKSLAVATDLGVYDERLYENLMGVNGLLLESNHDVKMLELGPYPYQLKQRILSNRGHISNEACGKLLARLIHPDFKGVLLGHLSKTNNFPELAFETVKLELEMSGIPADGSFLLSVAPPGCISEAISV